MEHFNCIKLIPLPAPGSRLPAHGSLIHLHMTRGRRGGGVVVLVPFVDVLHGYFDLYLLHIVAIEIRFIALAGCCRRCGPASGAACLGAPGDPQSGRGVSSGRQTLPLLGNRRQQRLVPVL